MKARQLNPAAHRENIKVLASAIGIDQEAAEELLDASVLISFDVTRPADQFLAEQIAQLLERTVSQVELGENESPVSVEIIIGNVPASSSAPAVFVSPCYPDFIIAGEAQNTTNNETTLNPVLSLIGACYVSAAALKAIAGDQLPYNLPDPFVLDLSIFGVTPDLLSTEVDIGTTYLAGAGAVGNAFLWALRHFNVLGKLNVVDDDVVSDGNLNRQIWFWEDDISHSKAERLAELAQPHFPNLELVPRVTRLEKLEEKNATAWLPRLVVAVDSRRVRRTLQKEIPGEVFDASTTDISEIVIHHNKQPTDLACLSCIYPQDKDELARERHIAEHLGVAIEDVQQHQIGKEAAKIITARFQHLHLTVEGLLGQAYDSLFKALCGQAQLQSKEGRQALAPFAFVSVLAGTVLAIEFVQRSMNSSNSEYNFWRLSPWQPPQPRLKRKFLAIPHCEFCGSQVMRQVTNDLWSDQYNKGER